MNIKGIQLEDTDISESNFVNANLEGSCMKRVNLSYTDFTGANLTNIKWDFVESEQI